MLKQCLPKPRLLVIPGLNDSGPAHWQTWLQSLHRDAVRVVQDDWLDPDLDRWAQKVAQTLARHSDHRWLVAAHGFGCLALARHLKLRTDLPVDAALLVDPADPEKHRALDALPSHRLPCATVLVSKQTTAFMSAAQAQAWSQRWGSRWINLGHADHANTESRLGPWPFAQRWVIANQQRLAKEKRPAHAAFSEWTFAF